jgi:aryl-alcohol dehydrogenase-like predicted oxidoreductase
VVLSGAATVAQVQSNVRAVEVSWDQQAEERLAMAEPAEEYWSRRGRLAWN